MKKYWIPLVLYIVMIGILLFPAIISGPDKLLYGDDIHQSYYFYRQFFNSWMCEGMFPWWNPYTFSGTPFIANPIVNIWYPANWIYSVVPLPYAYIAYLWFHLTLGASGMYLLIRFLLSKKESFIPSMTGGMVFSLSGFMTARIMAGHVDIIAAASYMPIVVLLFFRLMKKRRLKDIVLAGLAFGLQLLAGYHTMGFFTLIVVGSTGLYVMIQEKSLRPFLFIICAVFVGFGISAISLLPIQEFVGGSIRTTEKPYAWTSWGSMPLTYFFRQLIDPFPYGKPLLYTGPPPSLFEHAFYFGKVTLGAICIGFFIALFKKKSLGYGMLFLAIFLFGIWMSLGSYAPVDLQYILWKIIPFYQVLRIPPRHLIMVVFGASVLVGLGMSVIQNRFVKALLSFLVITELFLYGQHFIMTKDLPEFQHDSSLISFLKDDTGVFRILPNFGGWMPPSDALDLNEVMAERLFSVTGYDPMMYRPYYEFIDATNGNSGSSSFSQDVHIPYLAPSSPAMHFLNIKYLFVLTAADPFNGKSTDQFLLIKENADLRLYEQTKFSPRFFFVPTITVFDTYLDLVTAIRQQRVDLADTIGVEKKDIEKMIFDADCKVGEVGSVDILSYTPNKITLRVSTPCNAFLSGSEVMYPGWEAMIDEKKTSIITGNMAFRTLYVPKGEHTVTYVFTPWIFYKGCAITIITIGIILLWFIRKRKGKKT